MSNPEDTRKGDNAAPKDGKLRHKGKKGGKPAKVQAAPAKIFENRHVVEKREGVRLIKVARVDAVKRAEVGVEYLVEFDGCKPLSFPYLSAARERAKEPPPAPEEDQIQSQEVQSKDESAPVESVSENPSPAEQGVDETHQQLTP